MCGQHHGWPGIPSGKFCGLHVMMKFICIWCSFHSARAHFYSNQLTLYIHAVTNFRQSRPLGSLACTLATMYGLAKIFFCSVTTRASHVFSVDDIELWEEQGWQIYNIAQSYFNLALPSAQNKWDHPVSSLSVMAVLALVVGSRQPCCGVAVMIVCSKK
jgi:hypothetical protein